MADRTRGHSVAARYSCDLPFVRFEERVLPSGKGVERLAVAADGRRLTVSVTTKILGTPKRAEQVARDAAEDIWWGLQREIARDIGSATWIVRDSISFSFVNGRGDVAVSATNSVRVTMSGDVEVGVDASSLDSAAHRRRPAASPAADLYRDAVAERDPVAQFAGLYSTLVLAAETKVGCECQRCTDEFVASIEPATKLEPCTPREKKVRARFKHSKDPRFVNQTTVFTALRNRLDHAHSPVRMRQGGWVATTAEIRGAVGALRAVVARALIPG